MIESETFRLNDENKDEKELIDYLAKSNNKSAVTKEALSIHKFLYENNIYISPYITKDCNDCYRILKQLVK